VRHTIDADTSGDPAIFFRSILADWAVDENTLADVTGTIARILVEQIRPIENWGLIPYFSFRGNAEQSMRTNPEWA